MGCGWPDLRSLKSPHHLCGTHRATLTGQGLGATLAPVGLKVHSGVLPQ